ncbi:MAG: Uma2 family endonuclease [Chitinophagaceae bacterium]
MGISKRKNTNPPRTAMEVYEMLPLGTLAEVMHNTIYMSPAPSFEHQRVVGSIFLAIENYSLSLKLGITVISPVDIYLDEKNVLQPDIVFLSNKSLRHVKSGKIKGTPDLIVEVLSPGNEKHDLEKKKDIYEAFGVKEYFIVEPKTKAVISYYLVRNKFSKQPSAKRKINSRLLNKSFEF